MKKTRGLYIVLGAIALLMAFQSVSLAQDANLQPARPVGWAFEIVVMDQPDNYGFSGTITQSQQVYINFAWKNVGATAAPAHTARLFIDGQEAFFRNVADGELAAGAFRQMNPSQPFTFETSGTHTLQLRIEVNGVAADPESIYTRNITVQSDNQVHLRPATSPNLPTGWTDAIMVSPAAGSDPPVEGTVYVNTPTYLSFAWFNIGDVDANPGTYTAVLDVELGGNLVTSIDASV